MKWHSVLTPYVSYNRHTHTHRQRERERVPPQGTQWGQTHIRRSGQSDSLSLLTGSCRVTWCILQQILAGVLLGNQYCFTHSHKYCIQTLSRTHRHTCLKIIILSARTTHYDYCFCIRAHMCVSEWMSERLSVYECSLVWRCKCVMCSVLRAYLS